MALISVILPCYNAESYIKAAVGSIFTQTFQNWELIIVDDASTDGSVSAISTFSDSRISVIQLKKNYGYPAAMNMGIAKSSGRYIARMDADDVSAPTRLQEQIKALELHPEAAFCGLARYRITPGGKMYADKKKPDSYYKLETWENLMAGNRIFTDPSVMIEKEKLIEVGGYRTFQRSGMDVDLWLRAMERFGPCVTITEPLFGKRLEPGSIIFNPKTYLINQVPRVLARQRAANGKDDVQAGNGVNVEDYIKRGLLKEGENDEKIGLFYGAAVTCLWLKDWKGARIYFRQIRLSSGNSLASIMFEIARKTLARVRSNPYERWK